MTLRLRKVTFQVYYDQLDNDGNVIGEPAIQSRQTEQGAEQLTLWAHQLDELAEQIAVLTAEADAQMRQTRPNRATRRRSTSRAKTRLGLPPPGKGKS